MSRPDDGSTLIVEAPTARIAGLMFTGGSEKAVLAEVRSGSPVIEDCLFEVLKPTNAMLVQNANTKPIFRRCTFRGAGGNMPAVWVANHGKPTFEECLFTGGSGGVWCTQGSRSVLRACRFFANALYGAAVDNGCTASFENCAFKSNKNGNLLIADGAEVTKTNCLEE